MGVPKRSPEGSPESPGGFHIAAWRPQEAAATADPRPTHHQRCRQAERAAVAGAAFLLGALLTVAALAWRPAGLHGNGPASLLGFATSRSAEASRPRPLLKAPPTPCGAGAGAGCHSPGDTAAALPAGHLRLPWPPRLTQQDAERGLAYYGTGERLRAVAAKLLAGRPIKAYTLGGSVTFGVGATQQQLSYPSCFFQFLNASFPHRGHVFENKAVRAATSAIFSACAELMVPLDADLIVLEFTLNEEEDAPFDHPLRRSYEQLLRKLLALPGRPALVQLHHWAWYHNSRGTGELERGLYFEPAAEAQLAVMAQYYDVPVLSLRAAAYHLMQAGIGGFQVDAVRAPKPNAQRKGVKKARKGDQLDSFFYYDTVHPSNGGHQVLAELLAALMLRAVGEAAVAPRPPASSAAVAAAFPVRTRNDARLAGLPPPMIPGNEMAATTLCALEEAFQPLVVAHSGGFRFLPEHPEAEGYAAQKWAWTASHPGDWVELEFDSRRTARSPSTFGIANGSGSSNTGTSSLSSSSSSSSSSVGKQPTAQATVLLAHLRSHTGGMGTALVACASGCACSNSTLDGTWGRPASLRQLHEFQVSQHRHCRIRIRVERQPGAVPQNGHKVSLMGLMVSFDSLRLAGGERLEEASALLGGR